MFSKRKSRDFKIQTNKNKKTNFKLYKIEKKIEKNKLKKRKKSLKTKISSIIYLFPKNTA